MSSLLPSGPMLIAFLAASLLLAATPGPGVLYVVTRTLAQGRAAGLASVAGVALGNLGNVIGASVGLAALFAVSPAAFTVVRFAGAAFLVALGLRALLRREDAPVAARFEAPRVARILREGFVVAFLNPKTALFFAAFLPQFIDTGAPTAAGSVLLGAAFVVIAAGTDTAYVLAAGVVAARLAGTSRGRPWARYATAATFIGLGLYTAATGGRR